MRLPILAVVAVLLAPPALPAPRAALVIGNETYMMGQPAPGAVAAAQEAAEMLEAADFEVRLGLDLDIGAMAQALRDFEDHVRDAEIALVVYVGRAVASAGPPGSCLRAWMPTAWPSSFLPLSRSRCPWRSRSRLRRPSW